MDDRMGCRRVVGRGGLCLAHRDTGETLMPEKKRKRAPQKSLVEKLPENIREAAVMRRQSVRPAGMTKYQKQMFLLFMPEISRWFFARLLEGVAKGNKADKEMWAEMSGHIQRNRGININQVLNQQNKVDAGSGPRFSMDQIVRELQAAKEQRVIDVTPALGGSDVDNVAMEA